jgi:replicative DNA helicase
MMADGSDFPADRDIPFPGDETSEGKAARRIRESRHRDELAEAELLERVARPTSAGRRYDGIVGGYSPLRESRLPPHNNEAEQALLGALLFSNKTLSRVSEFLEPQHFADAVHGRIYEAICELVDAGSVANVITLKARFDQDGALQEIGGAKYLANLTASVVTIIGAEDYGRTILDCFSRRRLLALADDVIAAVDEGQQPAAVIAAELAGELEKVAAEHGGQTKADVAMGIYDALDRPRAMSPTGIASLDDAIGGGLLAGKLYGIAARKKVGKTILLGTISHNLNRAGIRHGFLCLEMDATEIEQRNIAREMGFNSFHFLKQPAPTWLKQRVGDYAARAREWNHTVFEHRPHATFSDVKRFVAREAMRGARGIVVDYWQIILGRDPRDSEEFHLRIVAQWLADTARKLGIWILIACQVNQEGNTRGGEGLKLACDMYFTLHREKAESGAWLEMEESRFTAYCNVGAETMPGFWLHKIGPHFSADPPPYDDHLPGSNS